MCHVLLFLALFGSVIASPAPDEAANGSMSNELGGEAAAMALVMQAFGLSESFGVVVEPYDMSNTAATPDDGAPPPPRNETDHTIDYLWTRHQPGFAIRPEQRDAMRFLSGPPACNRNTQGDGLLLVAPTGWGKSACFLLLPSLMNSLHPRADGKTWIALLIQPFTALLRSTVHAAEEMGLEATFLGPGQRPGRRRY